MNKKAIGIIVIAAGVVLLVGIAYIFFMDGGIGSSSGTDSRSGEIPQVIGDKNGGTDAAIENNKEIKEITIDSGGADTPAGEGDQAANDPGQIGKSELKSIAQSFAERFGTYSNQSNFVNITSLKIFMSQSMKRWADDYIAEQKGRNYDTSIYYGITTKAVSAEFQEYDDEFGSAGILIGTRRRESTGTTNNSADVFSQSLLVKLVKEEGAWKVNEVSWQ